MKTFAVFVACTLLIGYVASQEASSEDVPKKEHHVYTFEAPAEQVQVGDKLLTKRQPKLTDPKIPIMTLGELEESKTPGNSFAEWRKARRDYRRKIASAVDSGDMTMKDAVQLVRESSMEGDLAASRGPELVAERS